MLSSNRIVVIGTGAVLLAAVLAGAGWSARHPDAATVRVSGLRLAPNAAQVETARRLDVAAAAIDQAAAAVMVAAAGDDPAARKVANASYLAAQANWAKERRAFWAVRPLVDL